jgi:hypothetical protein
MALLIASNLREDKPFMAETPEKNEQECGVSIRGKAWASAVNRILCFVCKRSGFKSDEARASLNLWSVTKRNDAGWR